MRRGMVTTDANRGDGTPTYRSQPCRRKPVEIVDHPRILLAKMTQRIPAHPWLNGSNGTLREPDHPQSWRFTNNQASIQALQISPMMALKSPPNQGQPRICMKTGNQTKPPRRPRECCPSWTLKIIIGPNFSRQLIPSHAYQAKATIAHQETADSEPDCLHRSE